MAQNFDTKYLRAKVASNTPLSKQELNELLDVAEHYQAATSYLADCQAATLEGLPKSASRSTLMRHAHICRSGSALLNGPGSMPFQSQPEAAQQRCLREARSVEAYLESITNPRVAHVQGQ